MLDIVYIDQEDGKKRVMNNTQLYAKLLGKFRDGTTLDEVFSAIEAGNYPEAQEMAHAIKGITANLSIIDLNQKIVELESQIKAKSVDPALIETVKASYAATIPEVDKVIAENA